jgi:PAS domain S-box-containing protein
MDQRAAVPGARAPRRFAPRAEAAALGVFLIAAAALVCFRSPAIVARIPVLQPYVLFLPLLWAALRFGPKGAATGTFIVAVIAVWGTCAGHGAFIRADRVQSLAALHVFLATIALASLVLGAVVSERERLEVLGIERELRVSEERLRLAVEAAHLGAWFWDVKDGPLSWTPLCKRMHGIGADEEINYERFLASLHPADRARTDREVKRAFEERADYRIEHRVVWPDGSVHWISGLGRVLHDEAGKPDKMLGVAFDITESKRCEAERAELLEREQAALAEARAATRAKDDFLAVLSHELRTPLQAMLGWTQMLKARAHDAGAVQKGLATIERNGKAQAQLIEDLLDVSRIVAGKLRLERRPVDLAKIAEAALETGMMAADAKAIRIDAAIEPAAGPVFGDPDRLQQIVVNLLANAVKFTPIGGHIGVRLERERATARIVIEDSGRGISPGLLPHVFDRFRQAESGTTRRQGGLGLGLTIVRHLVEMHEGTVKAESPGEGCGATFTVTLPVAGSALGAAEAARGKDGRAGILVVLKGVRVLLVEDDPDARELLGIVLRDAGAQVRAVCSVRAALAELAPFRPHVLLSDIGLPEEDGYALIQQLRARESAEGGHLPALALSAFASPADREQAIALGFEAHMAKPVSPEDLTRAVANLVRRAA